MVSLILFSVKLVLSWHFDLYTMPILYCIACRINCTINVVSKIYHWLLCVYLNGDITW